MSELIADISVSLDGFAAGPNIGVDAPLGEGGHQLHQWAFATRAFNRMQGQPGGEESRDSEVLREWVDRIGATVMGRRMYSGGEGPWENDPMAGGWWGDEPPFHHPVFVLTHHPREPLAMEGDTTFTFVTDGIEAALERAREAAGGKAVTVGGGASVVQQYLAAGLLDEIQVHLVPVLLGDGERLFDGIGGGAAPQLECIRAIDSPAVTHLTYRVRR